MIKIAVIGGGPAGIFAALNAKNKNTEVHLFEKNSEIGKKLLISGKGRCNITNICNNEVFMENVVSNRKFLFSGLNAFDTNSTINYFNSLGLELSVERGGRVFPASNKSIDVIKTLKKELERKEVIINLSHNIETIEKVGNQFILHPYSENTYDKLIIATGGISYPQTGSTGYGYKLAKYFGHNVINPLPALVGIMVKKTKQFPVGLSLKNVNVSVVKNGKTIFSEFGELLFTHQGLSGPTILKISSYINRLDTKNLVISIDLKPALSKEKLDSRLLKDFNSNMNKQIKNALNDLLPQKMIPYIIDRAGIDDSKEINLIDKNERLRLLEKIKNLDFRDIKLESVDKAIVTAGGVDTKEINARTMESLLIKNLFFAGELIDLDALTGGYNIQIALTTGFLAGKSAGII